MRQVRIGCYGAFWGDSPWAMKQFLEGKEAVVDYLVADYLAELTMGLLARSLRSGSAPDKSRRAQGFVSEFVDLCLMPNLDLILGKGIKIVTNAGGLDPVGLKSMIDSRVAKRGLSDKVKIAAVHGDDILDQKDNLLKEGLFQGFDPLSGAGEEEEGLVGSKKYLSMNAYLGGQPIAQALKEGANIVVTGRCVDSALVLGPVAFEYGWDFSTDPQSLDQLASASLAAHIIECGAQATGGNYTDWKKSAFSPNGGWANMGYPILSYFEDNSFTITKPEGTGGVVSFQSICEQMLYEVLDPENYVLPDTLIDMSQVNVIELSPNRVLVKGARGKPPTPWLKCTAVQQQGYRILVDFLVCGEEAESKARALGRAILDRTNAIAAASHSVAINPISAEDSEIIVIGAEHSLYPLRRGSERREVVLRVAARHEKRSVLEILGKEAASFLTNSAPGICMMTTGRPKSSPNFVASSILVRRDAIKPVIFVGSQVVPVAVPLTLDGCREVQPSRRAIKAVESSPLQPTTYFPSPALRVKLHDIAIGRSGDKGDTANIAIIAREPGYYDCILKQVTAQVVFSTLRHFIAAGGTVTRFEVPGVHAVNFVVTKALGGGGLSSLRLDRQAKSYAQLLLSTIFVDIPANAAILARL